jgi:hypothetical protein
VKATKSSFNIQMVFLRKKSLNSCCIVRSSKGLLLVKTKLGIQASGGNSEYLAKGRLAH